MLRQAVTTEGKGGGSSSLAGLRLPAGGAVHGGTAVAFSCVAASGGGGSVAAAAAAASSSSSKSGAKKKGGAAAAAKAGCGTMQTSMMVVGSEAGAVIAATRCRGFSLVLNP